MGATTVIVYFDTCCLKRPFDDQTQPRIQLETQAVVYLDRAVDEGRIQTVCSPAQEFENAQNPDPRRAAAVRVWLDQRDMPDLTPDAVIERAREVEAAGLRPLDALHLAWAEHLGADVLVTVDDLFLRKAPRVPHIMIRVSDPLAIVKELAT